MPLCKHRLGGQQTWNLFHYPTRYYPTIWLLSSLPTTFLEIENTGGLEFSYLLRIHKSIGPPPPLLSAIGIFCKYYRTMIGGSGDILWERMVGCLENGPKWYFGFKTEEVQLATVGKLQVGKLQVRESLASWKSKWSFRAREVVVAPGLDCTRSFCTRAWLHHNLMATRLQHDLVATDNFPNDHFIILIHPHQVVTKTAWDVRFAKRNWKPRNMLWSVKGGRSRGGAWTCSAWTSGWATWCSSSPTYWRRRKTRLATEPGNRTRISWRYAVEILEICSWDSEVTGKCRQLWGRACNWTRCEIEPMDWR